MQPASTIARSPIEERPSPVRRLAAALVPCAVYLVAAIIATYPLIRVGDDHLLSHFSPEDVLLHTWNLSWDVHALGTRPTSLFDANILHPARRTLALSEHLLGQLPVFAPVRLLTGNAVLAFNVNEFASFFLSGLFMHAVVRRLAVESYGARAAGLAGAYVAGLAYALAPWRLAGFHWAQLFSVQYFPLAFFALERAAARRSARWGLLAGAALAMQMLCSYYLAFMAVVLAGCQMATHVALDAGRARARLLAAFAPAVIVPAAIFLPVSLPYLELRRAGILALPVVVTEQAFAAMMAAFGAPWRVLAAYVGWGTVALAVSAVLAIAAARRHAERESSVRIVALVLSLIVALGCAAGPAGLLGGWFAPYAWLAALVPGFSAVRLPARFGILASFVLSLLAGLGAGAAVDHAARRSRSASLLVAACAVALALLPLAFRPPPRVVAMPVGPSIPPVYRWLAAHGDGGPLLELPVSGGLPAPGTAHGRGEAMAMYYSTVHWLPLLNGYSGYFPRSYEPIMQSAAKLPEPRALGALVDCAGLRWIVLRDADPETRAAWSAAAGVRERGSFPRTGTKGDVLYEVELGPIGECPLDLGGATR